MTAPDCLFCGEPEFVEVFEIWPDERAFMFETCCEHLHECIVAECQEWTRAEWCAFADGIGMTDYVPVRQIFAADSGGWAIDYGLTLGELDRPAARAFVETHHRHNRPPPGDRFRLGVWNGHELVAVAIVGRPVARMIDAETTCEVNRLCVDPTLDRALVWNACSMLYGAAAREAKRRGYERIITYTLETEPGTTLRAAGWTRETKTKGGSWNRPSRAREDTAPTCRKWRWARELRKARRAA